MLMKYKDFKMLSKGDMKKIAGGNPPVDGGMCSLGPCTLYVEGSGTFEGHCRPLISGGTVATCYCATSFGEYVNPFSHCNAG
jgi:hypothetical protein